MSAYYDPDHSSVQRFREPFDFSDTLDDQKPADAQLTPSHAFPHKEAHLTPSHAFPHKEAHLTPSHAFPPTADSEIMDPQHARASLSKSDSTDSGESHPHHHAEKGYESCASCRAKGEAIPGAYRQRGRDGCTCVIGEGSVPTETHGGNAGKGGSQNGIPFLSFSFPCRRYSGSIRLTCELFGRGCSLHSRIAT